MKTNKVEVGKRIHELRTAKNLSMDELAKNIHVSGKSTINEWEKGRTSPNKASLQNLADFFQVTTDFIKFGDLENYVVQLIKHEWNQESDGVSNKISLAIQSYLSATDFYQMWDDLTASGGMRVVGSVLEDVEDTYLRSLIDKCLPKIMEVLNNNNIGYNDHQIINVATDIIQKETWLTKLTFLGNIQAILNFLHEDMDKKRHVTKSVPDNISLDDYMNSNDILFRDTPFFTALENKYDAYFDKKLMKISLEFQEQLISLSDQYRSNLKKYVGNKDTN